MPGDGEDAIGLDQKPEGTGKPDRSASVPRQRVERSGLGFYTLHVWHWKNNASGANSAGSVWIVDQPAVLWCGFRSSPRKAWTRSGGRVVRVEKARQIKNREPRFDSIETEKAPAAISGDFAA